MKVFFLSNVLLYDIILVSHDPGIGVLEAWEKHFVGLGYVLDIRKLD